MPSNASQTIFILFLVAVGFLVGAVLATVLAGREKSKKTSLPPTTRVESKPAPALNPDQFEEVVGLWRAKGDGRLVVLQGGKAVELASQLPEGKRKQMELAAREWVVWMGLLPSQAKAQPIPTASAPKAEFAQPATSSTAPGPVAQAASAAATAAPVEVKKAGSIVQQINEVLQENLRASGMTGRGISLVEDLQHGVIVYVGLQRFPGIDSVTDPEIRALIKSAVAEWERRSEQAR